MSDGGAGLHEKTIGLPLLERGHGSRRGESSPRANPRPSARSAAPRAAADRLLDSHGRVITDLRLSITDRCNFRCVYCLDPGVRFAPAASLLTVDELRVVATVCVDLGVERIRITGGEPTVRPDLEEILSAIASLPIRDLSMTTNGAVATRDAMTRWRDAGLRRLTFSLDAVSAEGFARITRSSVPVDAVIAAIGTAIELGLGPVKVNAVIMRGRNENEVAPLAALARRIGFEMRFIEYMPLDSGRRWEPALLVPAAEILERAAGAGALRAMGRDERHSTSESFTFEGDAAPGARIGVIAPVTRSFCGACSRLRITADGRVRPCLFSLEETDLMDLLRAPERRQGGAAARTIARDDSSVTALLRERLLDAVWSKQAGHGITERGFRQPERTMSAIGG